MIKKIWRWLWKWYIPIWILNIVLWGHLIEIKAIPRLWVQASVHPSMVLPTPIINGESFEYCILLQDAAQTSNLIAGTPIPMQPVPLGPAPTEVTAMEPIGPTPIFEPTVTQPVINGLDSWQVEVADVGRFKKSNFHLVVIGIGYTTVEENEAKLREIISGLKVNFAEVHIDFAYVRNPLNLDLGHVDQGVDFSNPKDLETLLAKIRRVHPVDGVAIAIETPLFLGTSDAWQSAMFSANDPNTVTMATHEIGHLLELDDGYKAYYLERSLPNSELFYSDQMPRILSDALPKLKNMPPLYGAGTCKGIRLYTFYERSNNIMSDYNPSGSNSWGDSIFTPLQIQIMNDYIDTLKGGN